MCKLLRSNLARGDHSPRRVVFDPLAVSTCDHSLVPVTKTYKGLETCFKKTSFREEEGKLHGSLKMDSTWPDFFDLPEIRLEMAGIGNEGSAYLLRCARLSTVSTFTPSNRECSVVASP